MGIKMSEAEIERFLAQNPNAIVTNPRQIPATTSMPTSIAPAAPEPARLRPQRTPRPTPQNAPERVRVSLVVEIVGLSLVSEANKTGKVRAKIARRTKMAALIEEAFEGIVLPPTILQPYQVLLTRIGGKRMDDGDNLDMAFKAIKDCVANFLGVNDGNRAQVRWKCRQKPGYRQSVIITIKG